MLKYLLEKEFKHFFRNPFLPKLGFGLPFFAMLIFPLVANFEVKNINLGIIDNDKSNASRFLTEKIISSGNFKLYGVYTTYNEALEQVEKENIDIILEIPQAFEQKLIREQETRLMVSANAINIMKGGMGGAYLQNIIANYNQSLQAELVQPVFSFGGPQITVKPAYRFNQTLNYKFFIIPAVLVMIMAIICGFLPTLNIVSEKESGTIEQINVSPIKRFTFVISKLIPYWVIGFAVLTIGIIVARFVYSFAPAGNILLLYFYILIFISSFSGFGLVVSNYATNIQQSMFIMFFFMLTFILLSGLYTPFDNMPLWTQILGSFSPLKYIIEVVRLIYLKGSGLLEMLPQLGALCTMAIGFNYWAIVSYRKKN